MPKVKVAKTKNLIDSLGDLPPPKEIEEVDAPEQDNEFYPHFKNELYLYVVYDVSNYKA